MQRKQNLEKIIKDNIQMMKKIHFAQPTVQYQDHQDHQKQQRKLRKIVQYSALRQSMVSTVRNYFSGYDSEVLDKAQTKPSTAHGNHSRHRKKRVNQSMLEVDLSKSTGQVQDASVLIDAPGQNGIQEDHRSPTAEFKPLEIVPEQTQSPAAASFSPYQVHEMGIKTDYDSRSMARNNQSVNLLYQSSGNTSLRPATAATLNQIKYWKQISAGASQTRFRTSQNQFSQKKHRRQSTSSLVDYHNPKQKSKITSAQMSFQQETANPPKEDSAPILYYGDKVPIQQSSDQNENVEKGEDMVVFQKEKKKRKHQKLLKKHGQNVIDSIILNAYSKNVQSKLKKQ